MSAIVSPPKPKKPKAGKKIVKHFKSVQQQESSPLPLKKELEIVPPLRLTKAKMPTSSSFNKNTLSERNKDSKVIPITSTPHIKPGSGSKQTTKLYIKNKTQTMSIAKILNSGQPPRKPPKQSEHPYL